MQSTEETHNGNGSCSSGPQVQPCACCAALAQLRMPWMDAAVQHAAPHYPQQYPQQYSQPGYQPYPYPSAHQQQYHRDQAADFEQEESESKTVFFKLPGFGKKNKKKKEQRKPSYSRTLERALQEKGEEDGADDHKVGDAKEEGADFSPNDAAEASTDAASDPLEADWEKPKKAKFRLAFGLQGLAVGLFGMLIPAFLFASTILSTPKRITLVALHHPVETAIEFLLVLSIPLVNFLVWSAICKQRFNLSRWLLMGLGAGVGTSLFITGVSIAALFGNHEDLADAIGTDFSMGFIWLAMLAALSAAVSAYLANRLRLSWELQSSRLNVSMQAITGLVLAILAFVGAEYRPWCIRMAQYNAVSKNDVVRKEGLTWLRQINPEREMRMECSDSRAAGLPGLFFPIKSAAQQQLYFTLTGTPYSFRDEKATDLASMSDTYLSRHVVGDRIPHLDLTRSSLNGVLHPNTMTSTLNWTFVVKNGGSSDQEMRAEIGLPAGAAINGLTVWRKGESTNANFIPSGATQNGESTVAGGDTPAMITDLGHGRVLLHCYPVPREEELKVMVNMVVPLKSESASEASLVTPQLIATNFSLDGEHSLRLRSSSHLSSGVKGLETGNIPGGDSTISGVMSNEQLETSPLLITAKRAADSKPYAVLDKIAVLHRSEDAKEKERIRVEKEKEKERQRVAAEAAEKDDVGQVVLMIDGSKGVSSQFSDLSKLLSKRKRGEKAKVIKPRVITIKPQYVVEDIQRTAAPAPKHLVVVLDGSSSMKEYSKDISAAFAKLPAIPTSVIVASQENDKKIQAKRLNEILPNLDKIEFVGGQDNLKAVVRAAELAGETKDSAVLWIHGPQPVLNQEIYIMSPYESAPAFYELPVVAGTDTFEFFKNHSEIGPFTQVPRNGKSVAHDLTEFFTKWNPHNNSLVATLSQVEKLPADAIAPSKEEAKEMLTLRAAQECNRLISQRYFRRASRIALAYGFVSPVTSAILGSSTAQPDDADNKPQAVNADAVSDGTTGADTAGASAAPVKKVVADAFDVSGIKEPVSTAPILQGATNGTIGPQGSDATVIMGVNTAGTVRVNNLANLEALLNILANGGEIGALLVGLGLIAHGFMNKAIMKLGEDIELGPGGRMCLGGIIITLGLLLPGIINWFVASARDANLFS